MEMLKDYVDNNAIKDFQCVNQGACRAPFVQQLLVNAATDLQEYTNLYFFLMKCQENFLPFKLKAIVRKLHNYIQKNR